MENVVRVNRLADAKSEAVTHVHIDAKRGANLKADSDCRICTMDFADFLEHQVPVGKVDLILTDPPYTISRKTGFKSLGPKSVARFAVDMHFGDWDVVEIDRQQLAKLAFAALRQGGTAIVFYDVWKTSHLAEAMEEAGFKQIRLIEWIKTNPVPLNSKRNYLTNGRECAVLGVKGGKPTFNSEYDNGMYYYPIAHSGKRLHPTQKPLQLMADLVRKHSAEGDLVIDPFLGAGTTAVAALQNQRRFAGCDKDAGYVAVAKKRLLAVMG